MSEFLVIHIVDGDTFDVSPEWKWEGKSGSRVRPTGYDATELSDDGGHAAKEKLSRLILHKKVDLKTGHRIDRERFVCDVLYDGRNLADYFPEYQ